MTREERMHALLCMGRAMVMHELARGAGMPGALSCAAAQKAIAVMMKHDAEAHAQAAHIEALLIEAAAQANFQFIVSIWGQAKLKLKLCQTHRVLRAMRVTLAIKSAEYARRIEIFMASLRK